MLSTRLKITAILTALTLAVAASHAYANDYGSAANGRIAFTVYGAVFTVGPDGGGARVIPNVAWGESPVFSPSGRQLAAAQANRTLTIPSGGGRKRPIAEGLPTGYSPDGKSLLVVNKGALAYWRLDEKWRKSLGSGQGAEMSPDGASVAAGDVERDPGISLMAVSGGRRTSLTDPPAGYIDRDPTFSPDGNRVAFSRQPDAGTASADIYSIDRDGTGLLNLTAGLSDAALSPDFSPDGAAIAFVSVEGHQVMRMNPDGSGLRALPGTDGVSTLHPQISWGGTFYCAGEVATIVGDDGPDRLTGTKRTDVIVGNAGRDRIDGRGGRDVICGGDGRDSLNGGDGRDTLVGGPGRDRERQ